MYCNNCGKEISPNSRFCNHCGSPLMVQEPVPDSAPIPTATFKKKQNNPLVIVLVVILALSLVVLAGAVILRANETSNQATSEGGSSPQADVSSPPPVSTPDVLEPVNEATPKPTPSPTSTPDENEISEMEITIPEVEPVPETSGNDAQLEAVVAMYKDDFLDGMKMGFEQSAGGLECDCTMRVEGTTIIIECLIDGINNIPAENKAQMQEIYDGMNDTMKVAFTPFKEEAPNLSDVIVNVCEEDGDILASIHLEY